MSQQAPRPGQATLAAWLIIGGSVIVVATAWERISTLHTLEVQEELQRMLSEPALAETGLGVGTLQTLVRILCMVAAGAATASTILGIQALRRSTSARLALTLLAPLVLIGGFATAGFFAPMVVAGIAMLWLQPTRDWFAGRAWRSPGAARGAGAPTDPFTQRPPSAVDTQEPPASPSPPPAPVEPGRVDPARPGPYAAPFGGPASPITPYARITTGRRPGALVVACVLTWVSCALVTGMLIMLSLVLAVAREELFTELERQQPDLDLSGLSHAEVALGVYVLTAVAVVWCAVAVALAILAFRRVGWARIALAVCAGGVGVLTLAFAVVSPVLVVLVAAASITVWLLLRSDVGAWYRR